MNSELTDVGKWRFGEVSEMSEGGRRGGALLLTTTFYTKALFTVRTSCQQLSQELPKKNSTHCADEQQSVGKLGYNFKTPLKILILPDTTFEMHPPITDYEKEC